MTDPFAVMILTRPGAANAGFLSEFAPWPAGLDIVTSPLLEIVPTGVPVDLANIGTVIFTSQNGVLHGGPAGQMPVVCVGEATAETARQVGWNATCLAETSKELVQTLIESRPKIPMLHIGGVHRRGQVAQKLTQAGLETREVDVYDQQLLSLTPDAQTALQREVPKIVPLFSPRTARQFAQQVGLRSAVHYIAISDTVLAEVAHLPAASRHVARTANAHSLAETLRNVLHRLETGDIPQ